MIGAIAVAALTLLLLRINLSQGLAGFALVTAQTFVNSVHEAVRYVFSRCMSIVPRLMELFRRSAANLELDLTSVERLEQ